MNAAEFAVLKEQVSEIHLAVVGDGSAGSSLRERMSAAESNIRTLEKHVPSWRTRALQTAIQTVISGLVAFVGLHFPITPHQG